MASIEYWNRNFDLPPVYRETRWPNSHLVQALVAQRNQLTVYSDSNSQAEMCSFWREILPKGLVSLRITNWETTLLEFSLNAELAETKRVLLEPKATNHVPVVTVAVRVRLGEL